MKFLSDLAHLYINFQQVNTGSTGSCSYPTNNPCNLASSSGFYACGGCPGNCAGTYHAQHFAEMTLPDGWQFTSWPAEFCVELDNQQTLICTYSTEGTPVPPNA